MTDRELVLKTIEFLKPQLGHIDVVNSLWKDLGLSSEEQSRLRDILLEGELINLGADQWTMKLTAKAILLKFEELNEDGTIKQEAVIRKQKIRIDELEFENLTLQNTNLKLQNTQMKGKPKRDIIWYFAGFLSSLAVLYLGHFLTESKSESPQQIELKIDMMQNRLDTTLILNTDSIE